MAEVTVRSPFDGKAAVVRKTYDRLLKALDKIGRVKQEPKKTSIHLVNAAAFAGIATRKDYLILTLKTDHKLKSPRIHKTEQASAKRFHSELKLASAADVDRELISWLRESYALSG